ncbi:hypothetical protein U5N28_02600 [Lysinibacillus telephonicus]|uniref:hypothetical protein n=1 Tax=Lysinibacillus telephonicus TaxID=1714840 RepID=UPI00397AF645
MNKFMYLLIAVLMFLIGGCSNNKITFEETVNIGVVGTLEEFRYENVHFESLGVEDLLLQDDLKNKYSTIMIDDDHFNTVTQIEYIERFESLQIPIVFVDSTKGYAPFSKPSKNATTKQTYDEYNDHPKKMTVMLTYQLPAATQGFMVGYPQDETLSQEDFEKIIERIYSNK